MRTSVLPSRRCNRCAWSSAPSAHGGLHRRFIARRNATRRSSCCAMFSAMSVASISGLRISTMLRRDFRVGQLAEVPRRAFDVGALLPMKTPGRAAWTVTRDLGGCSITTRETPARLGASRISLAQLEVFVQEAWVLAARGVPAGVQVRLTPGAARSDRLSCRLRGFST